MHDWGGMRFSTLMSATRLLLMMVMTALTMIAYQ
jgi:hypothetical protein